MEGVPLLIILGPTASGKTKLAVQLAAALNGEIISADSRQVFRGMDIGTGKDLAEYELSGSKIRHHLIDIRDAGEKYHVDSFKQDFYASFKDVSGRGLLPILCGGTGMYIHSLLQNHRYTSIPVNLELRSKLINCSTEELKATLGTFPPKLTIHADQSTNKRLIRAIEVASFLQSGELIEQRQEKFVPSVIGLTEDVKSRRKKIENRLSDRFNQGLIREVESLLASGVSAEILTFYGLEYKMIVSYLKHEITLAELKERLFNGICQYAKRQMTFFRKMEKDGVKIRWYQADKPLDELTKVILHDLENAGFSRIEIDDL
ncbi:MAG: tRNA ((37)-N6)-dimethylallyltransferase MiaA [Pedobacter sp.]|jgi:tRNA dimethylallyltransferase|nr:tRNA ((37)-N6)-dimethylallyltransferase MiaA [Pedobacter sp.]